MGLIKQDIQSVKNQDNMLMCESLHLIGFKMK